jgi:alanine dehydrogenase
MRVMNASEVEAALETEALVEQLRQMFRAGAEVPLRHRHTVPVLGGAEASLLLMPAWQVGRYMGVKIVTVFPTNAEKSLPSVMAAYVLLSARTGEPLAMIDGHTLTLRRTACASALAAKYLARPDASRLLMVGTGELAPHLVLAHARVRPIKEVLIWGRTPAKAERLAHNLTGRRMRVSATTDLEGAVRGADIISCATLSKEPLVRGAWLREGQHIDLVGGFTPEMREADDEAIDRARVFVDTYSGALKEAGDIVQPMQKGILTREAIAGDLAELTQGRVAGRRFHNQITLFKSVGTAIEDLAAAILVFETALGTNADEYGPNTGVLRG